MTNSAAPPRPQNTRLDGRGLRSAAPRRPRRAQRARRLLARAARVIASTVTALALLLGVPWLLTRTVGNPLDRWPDLWAGDVNSQVVLAALATVVWLAWAQFAVAFAVELVSAVRRTPMPARIPGVLAAQQGLARALVNGALLLLPVTVAAVAPAGQALAMTGSAAPDAVAVPERAPAGPAQQATRELILTDWGPRTWWDLAEQHLGNGAAWRQLWGLNSGRVQPDGSVLTSERVVLRVGWTVLVPADAPAAAAPPPTTPTEVVVQSGDTLSQIAVDHGDGDWPSWWAVNAGRAEPGGQRFTDPDHLEPGWILTVPAPAGERTAAGTVTVAAGDTLSEIAAAHDVDLDALVAANQGVVQADGAALTDPDRIRPGWLLVLPGAAALDAGPPAGEPAPSAERPAAAPDPAIDEPRGNSGVPPGGAGGSSAGPPVPPVAAPPIDAAEPAPADGEFPADAGPPAFAVFAGGGGVLAAVLLAALIRYRRRQFRHRPLGQGIPSTPADLTAMERAVLTAGSATAGDAAWLDEALRGLAHQLAAVDGELPEVVAVCVTAEAAELVLDAPRTDPPGAWSTSADGTRWTLRRGDPTGFDPRQHGYALAPFPALATVGSTAGGEQWLLDLERIGSLVLDGDAERALALARFLAAELAHNAWAESVSVTLVGFGAEMAGMLPDRLAYAGDAAAALTRLDQHRRSVDRVVDEAGVSVLQGRLRGVAGDAWAVHVLLIAPQPQDAPALTALIEAVTADPGRSGAVVVVAGGFPAAGRWRAELEPDGVLTVPALGLSLIAQQVPAEQAAQLSRLLAFAAQPPAGTAPAAAPADDPATDGPRRGSVLDGPDAAYLEEAATTRRDLDALAPQVPPEVRSRVEAADDELDRDLAAWHDSAEPRPKITLLGGPVVRTASGQRLSAFATEVVAYLATRRAVTIEAYATDLWPDDPHIVGATSVKSKVRTSLSQVRKLLGVDPGTGAEYLPKNGGVAGAEYRLDGVLVDAELFRRLRVRGLARGPDGIEDLHAALALVQGAPLGARRPGGYGWLAATPVDHEYTAMIVDLAHVVATHHLAAGDPERAATAAQTALRAGSSEDTPLLDLVAACHAQGQTAQAEAYVRRILGNHDAQEEEDLPPRTYDVLRRRRWLPPAA